MAQRPLGFVTSLWPWRSLAYLISGVLLGATTFLVLVALATAGAAVTRVSAGGTVVDPEVVRQLLRRRQDPLQRLSPREREVLAAMAEGRSNAAIARTMFVTEAAVNKHIGSIFTKIDLPLDGDDHRRVLAVLTYLRAG